MKHARIRRRSTTHLLQEVAQPARDHDIHRGGEGKAGREDPLRINAPIGMGHTSKNRKTHAGIFLVKCRVSVEADPVKHVSGEG
jgi:hypothetical protein